MDLTKKSRGGRQVLRESRTGVACLSGRLSFTSRVPKGSVLSGLGSTPLHGVGYVGQSSSGSMRPPYSVRATWRILFARSDVRRPARALATVPTLTPNTLASLRPAPNGRIIFSIFFIIFWMFEKKSLNLERENCFHVANIGIIQISSNFFGRKV